MLYKILEATMRLPQVPLNAAMAYRAKAPIMVQLVNKRLEENPEINRLIGYNPLSMMHDNHMNHVRFMANVFRLNAYEMLVKTVIWVYRAYQNHGFSPDYFQAELEAWKNVVYETLGQEIGAQILQVYDFIIENHTYWISLSKEVTQGPRLGSEEYKDLRARFLEGLIQGASKTCLDIAEGIAKTRGIQALYLEVIQPSMYEIGRLWEEGEISVAQEHLASAIVGRIMAITSPLTERTEKGRSVVTAAPNEFHEMGARMVADLLSEDGWEVYYLGANAPQQELLKYLIRNNPDFLAISVAMPLNLDLVQDLIGAIRNQEELARLKVMVGGLAFLLSPDIWQKTGADGYAPDGRAAVELARSWWKNQEKH